MRLYHGSFDYMEEGHVLMPNPHYEDTWKNTDFYSILERYRPKHMLAHSEAVFMCGDPDDLDAVGAGTEWIFEVDPDGLVEKHDINWCTEISCAVSEGADENTLKAIAESYWNGVAHPNGPLWELFGTVC